MKWILALSMFWALPTNPQPPTLQKVAEIRVRYMADMNYKGHPPYSIGSPWKNGARFEGCGWGRRNQNPKTIGTCRPRTRLRLAADAVATGKFGTYRLRLWR
tara:strand:+ start:384 stop:689 length:306 start_codon:yes stop_codon:yes gene_type:complete